MLNKYPNVLPEPPIYAKLLAALYTGKKEIVAKSIIIAQIRRSPLNELNTVDLILLLQTSYSLLELATTVFIIFEKIKTGTCW